MVLGQTHGQASTAEHGAAVPQPREVHAALAQQRDQRSRTAQFERLERPARRSCRPGGHASRKLLPLLRYELGLGAREAVD